MATNYGLASRLVTADLVHEVQIGDNTTLVTGETGNVGPNGGYQVKISNTSHGCGSSGVYVIIKDTIPWTGITYEMVLTGVASCWSFNHAGSNYGPGGTGNLLGYSEAAGDIISRAIRSWEVPAFQTHNRTFACDNNSDNFFHSSFHQGDPKIFYMKRRRNVNGSLAGIQHGRACVAAGTTIIRNIRIWS